MPDVILRNLPFLLDCLRVTVELALVSAAGGTILGLVVALVRYLRVPILPLSSAFILSSCAARRCWSFCSSAISQFQPCSAIGQQLWSRLPRLYSLYRRLYRGRYCRAAFVNAGGHVNAGLASGLRRGQGLRLIVLPKGTAGDPGANEPIHPALQIHVVCFGDTGA